MANLSYSTPDIANGQALDATKVQGKFDDIETYLNSPGASAGIGTSNYYTNHADMAITVALRGNMPPSTAKKIRMKIPAGVAEFAPTLLTVSQDNLNINGANAMTVDATKTIAISVVMKKGAFSSESSVVTLSGTYNDTNGPGTVFSTTSFGSTVVTANQVILFEITATLSGSTPYQGGDTIITLWGQCLHRAKE